MSFPESIGRLVGGWSPPSVQSLALACIVVVITTRLLSGASASSPGRSGRCRPPLKPYWIPVVGSLFTYMSRPEKMFNDRLEIERILLLGRKHHIVSSREVVRSAALLAVNDANPFAPAPDFGNILGLSLSKLGRIQSHLTEVRLDRFSSAVLKTLSSTMPDLLSFLKSPVDQPTWERALPTPPTVLSDAGDTASPSAAEVDIFGLVSYHLLYSILAVIFPNAHANDKIDLLPVLTHFTRLQQDAHILALGLPWWTPIAQNSRSLVTRRRLLHRLRYLDELDTEHSEQIQNDLLGTDPEMRPYVALALLLRAAPAVWLAGWVVSRAVDMPVMEDLFRESTKVVRAWREPDVLGMKGRAHVDIHESLLGGVVFAIMEGQAVGQDTPTLTKIIRGCNTLYTGPGQDWRTFKLDKNVDLDSEQPGRAWELKRHEYIHLTAQTPMALPKTRVGDLDVRDVVESLEQGTLPLVYKLVVASVAATIATWDVRLLPKTKIPDPVWGMFVCTPRQAGEATIRIQSRDLSPHSADILPDE